MSGSESARRAVPAHAHAHPHPKAQDSSHRRPLGDVSPNIRQNNPSITSGKGTPMSSGQLKRSFAAATSDTQGFQYLKRRKLSAGTPLAQVSMPSPEHSGPSSMLLRDEPQPATPSLAPSVLPDIQEPTPTEPGTPTSSDNDVNETGPPELRSFSSLINYDPSSQPAVALEMHSDTDRQQHQPDQQRRSSPPQPTSIPSAAALLRLRLQLAMYKVRTNQIAVPFEDLQLPMQSIQRTNASLMPVASNYGNSLRTRNLSQTASNNRWITERGVLKSPVVASPHGFGNLAQTPTRPLRLAPDDMELTSSVVKGHVAEGLLGLRNAI